MLKLPTNAELDAIDMSHIVSQFNDNPEIRLLSALSGVEHYRFLTWLTNRNKEDDPMMSIADIGTFRGYSALCLASNPKNEVNSYDIDLSKLDIKGYEFGTPDFSYKGVQFYQADNQNTFDGTICNADIIFVDAWHHGEVEKKIYDYLLKKNWQGLLIFDDIDHDNFPGMREFWNSIEHPGKVNITHIGHHSGTGLIDFSVKA
jgi:predicted O-methyltransferase YrrM